MKIFFRIGCTILMIMLTACERNSVISGRLTIFGGVNVSSDEVSIGEKIDVSIGTSVIVTQQNSRTDTISSNVTITDESLVEIGVFGTGILLSGGTYKDVDIVFNFIVDDDERHVLGTLKTTLADVKEDMGVPVTIENISEGKHKISVIGKSEHCPDFEVNVSNLKSKDIFVGPSATLSGELKSDKLVVRNNEFVTFNIDHSRLLCRNIDPLVEVAIEYLLDGKYIVSSPPVSIIDDDWTFEASVRARNWSIGKHTLSIAVKTNIPQYSVDVSKIKPIEIEVVE